MFYPYNMLNRRTESEYAIRFRSPNDWYFKAFERAAADKVVWVPRITIAKIFTSEEEVEEFKFHFLKGRPCDIILIR